MAHRVWVMDIIWHTMIGVGQWLLGFWRQWSVEILLGVSFVIQLVLSLLAGFRWRGAPTAMRRLIWLFYVASSYVATTALGSISISGSSGERQLVAFWAPFFLLHLGGPDNITAYEFEDNQLSMRTVLTLVVQVGGTLVLVYSCISGSWALILAAWSMLFVCVAKYVERTLALHRANLGNIRRFLKGRRRRLNFAVAEGGDIALLMRAHGLFHICKHAMVDSMVEQVLDEDQSADTRKELFDLKWHELFKVMEMELSLMYDFLYTKASVVYTWHGYGIRAISPLAALTALLLVPLGSHGERHKQSDVVITCLLLAATFVQETASLLGALASSWTGFLIHSRQVPHQGLCTPDRWHRLRRALASAGLLANAADHHRRWSGSIGQFNLFQRLTLEKEPGGDLFWVGSETYLTEGVKQHVYRKVRHKVRDFRRELRDMSSEEKVKLAAKLSTNRGRKTLKEYGLSHLCWSLGSELQVGILTWHIATNIFLHVSQEAKVKGTGTSVMADAVRTLSNYLMHLLVERPHMLPGLVTRQLLEQTRRDLTRIWNHPAFKAAGETARQEQLASILHQRCNSDDSIQINTYLDRGIQLGKTLFSKGKHVFSKTRSEGEDEERGMVEVILEVWVDMLFYTSYRCSKESHAKQLAHGGDLTTHVWLLAEHAGLFIVPNATTKKHNNETGGDPRDTRTIFIGNNLPSTASPAANASMNLLSNRPIM